ncbi:GDSL-type esterase/lipase family protein [Streptomyces sp. BI20]|uniref:GDSL-type esterase/lipase family protein n=1 Tax=Streptomyces sp. BI20 TaxID=3403460 RepID=UPI003C7525B7
MRFLFVGDSMTVGCAGDFTWRYRMWRHLTAACAEPVEIVGPRTDLYVPPTATATATATGDDAATTAAGAATTVVATAATTAADAGTDVGAPRPVSGAAASAYADPAFPSAARRHLAGWGEGWQHMAPLIGPVVAEHRPDVLLVSLGLIDLGFYTDADQTEVNVRRFIAEARSARPDVRMVLMPVIPNVRADEDAPFGAQCARFNVLLAKAVADLADATSPLLLTDRPQGWDRAVDTYDGTHPSVSGEHRLAREFATVLHQAWSIGAPYTHPF